MSKPPEATRQHNSKKLLLFLSLRAIYFSTFQYETPCITWCRRPPYSAVDQLRLIGGLKEVNTMTQFEGNNFWTVKTCLSSPRSRVAQNQKTPIVTEWRAAMPKPAMVWLLGTSQIPLTKNGWVWWFNWGWHCTRFKKMAVKVHIAIKNRRRCPFACKIQTT